MSPAQTNKPNSDVEDKLPRRDLWLLPLLSIFTIAVLLVSGELTARHYFTSGVNETCIADDNVIGYRFRAHCVSHIKGPEGPWVTYSFNDCGYRTNESCHSKPPGAVRVALLGSSMSFGLNVDYDKTFAQRTADQLTKVLGRPVEVQNLGRPATSVISTFHQVDEALALKPDLVVLPISPYDIERIDPDDLQNRYKPITPQQFNSAISKPNLLQRVKFFVDGSALATAAQHYYYQDTVNFALMYLHYGDRADYLRQPFTPAWNNRFHALDVILAETKAKCDAQSVPLVVVEVPTLAQAALLQIKDLPAGVDPYAINRRLSEITQSRQIELVDPLSGFKNGPKINQLFYVLDGHINAEGHELVADAMVKQIVANQHEALSKQTTSQPVQRQER